MPLSAYISMLPRDLKIHFCEKSCLKTAEYRFLGAKSIKLKEYAELEKMESEIEKKVIQIAEIYSANGESNRDTE